MDDIGKDLLQKVNDGIKDKPLIYFSREIERGMGLENLLQNYHLCCIENSYFVEQLIEQGISVFCLEKELDKKVQNKSTNELLKNEKTQEWVRGISPDGFFGTTFKPQESVKFHIENLGGTYLGNDIAVTKKLENKFSADEFFQNVDISIPLTKITEIGENSYEEISNLVESQEFFIQLERGHTGNSTFFVNDHASFDLAKSTVGENKVKIAEYIKGQATTLNLCIDNSGRAFIGPMQLQLTGITGVAGTEGVTIGNDFTAGTELIKKLKDDELSGFINDLSQISKAINKVGYRGLIGLDLILKDGTFFFIEMNARQSANIPFETQLTLEQKEHPPLLLLHYAALLGIELDPSTFSYYQHLASLDGSQVFIRSNSDEHRVKIKVKNGIYRLQGDNSAMNWDKNSPELKDSVIFLDEDGDKPLIFQNDGIYLKDVVGGFILTALEEGEISDKLEEIARIQMRGSALVKKKLSPWLAELFGLFS